MKQSFTDNQGTSWTVFVTVGTLKRVKQTLGVDIMDVEAFVRQIQDPISLCDILYLACVEQAKPIPRSRKASDGRRKRRST